MRFAFTEQQLELRAAVRQVLERECTADDLRAITAAGPAAGAPDQPAPGRSAERWTVLARLGAPGVMVPADHGGLGLSEVDLVGVAEEAGWAGLPEPLTETAALAAPLLAEAGALAPSGSPAREVTARALPAMATGELVATVGGMELGDDGFVPTTRSGTSGEAVSTVRVAGATRAGLHLLARQAGDAAWEVHAVDHPVRILPTPSIDGTRDLGTVEWVPSPDTVVASGDQAVTLLGDLADRAALCAAAQLLGLSRRMLAMAADYAKERHQFGRPIGSFQAVKHLLAGARVRLEFAAPATYRAADSLARHLPDRSAHASMAKALASDAADLTARVALQVHGAIGYTWECDLHLYMKRAWALSAGWGDAAIHRQRVLAAALEERAG